MMTAMGLIVRMMFASSTASGPPSPKGEGENIKKRQKNREEELRQYGKH